MSASTAVPAIQAVSDDSEESHQEKSKPSGLINISISYRALQISAMLKLTKRNTGIKQAVA